MIKLSAFKLSKRVTTVILAIAVLYVGLAFFVSTNRAHALSYKNFTKIVNKYRQEGNPDANITIVEYSDFQCPWCRKFEEKDASHIIKNYVRTGKIFMIYRDFPLTMIHPYAFKSAEYADCSALQGKYLQVRSLLYRYQKDWTAIGDIYYFLKTHAGKIINLKKVQSCVQSGLANKLIKSNINKGTRMGITGTPTIFVYKGLMLYKKIVGYRPYSQLNKTLKKAIN